MSAGSSRPGRMDATNADRDRPELLSSRLTEEDRSTIQWIGSKLSQVLVGRYEEVPALDRGDELGVLANMVSRVSRELRTSRRRDQERRDALEQKVQELEL